MKMKITIPTKLSDIKLSQYQQFVKEVKEVEDENIIARKMVKIFCNVPDVVVDNMKVTDFEKTVNIIDNTLQKKPSFIQKFKMDGVNYGFIPKLDDITLGEKADLDEYFKDFSTMDKAMAVLYRPITVSNRQGYLIEDYKADADGLDVPLSIALGAQVFFSNLISDLLSFTQSYIKNQVARNPKVSQRLGENGDGTAVFINSLEEIYSDLMMLQNYHYTKLY